MKDSTVKQFIDVLCEHSPDQESVRQIILDLRRRVDGNKEVRELIRRMWEVIK